MFKKISEIFKNLVGNSKGEVLCSSKSQATDLSMGFFKSVGCPEDWCVQSMLKSGKLPSGALEDIHSVKLYNKDGELALWTNYEHPEYSTSICLAAGVSIEDGKAFIAKFDGYCGAKAEQSAQQAMKTVKAAVPKH